MPPKKDRAAKIIEETVDNLETATAAAGLKVKRGLNKAVATVAASEPAERLAKQAKVARRVGAKKAGAARQAGKKQVRAVAKRAEKAKQAGKKQVRAVAKRAAPAKKAVRAT